MASSYQKIVPPPTLGSAPGPGSSGASVSSPRTTQTAELGAKAVLSQGQLEKFRQTRPIYLRPLNEAGKGTNFPYRSLAQPTPARVLEYFSPTLATQLANNPFRMNLEVDYPREHVDAISKWMKNGGGSWTHGGRFCRRLQEVEDMGAFVGLVNEWGIGELAPHAERELEAAKKRATPPANTKESSASGKKPAPLQKQILLQEPKKPASRARGTGGRECFGCGSTEHILSACPQRNCARCGGGGHREVDCTHFTNFQVVGILVKDELGHRLGIPSDGLNPKCVGVSPDGERVFEIVGTVTVSEYGLTTSRNKQERIKTRGQKKQPSGESSVPKPTDSQ